MLVLASVAVWYLIYLIPGNPAYTILGLDATPAQVAHEQAVMGLDKPLPVQYWLWLSHVVHGDLGTSLISGLPVTTLAAGPIVATLQLLAMSFVLGVVIAIPMGTLAAAFPRSWIGWSTSTYTSVAQGLPTFWLGILLILLFQ